MHSVYHNIENSQLFSKFKNFSYWIYNYYNYPNILKFKSQNYIGHINYNSIITLFYFKITNSGCCFFNKISLTSNTIWQIL